MLAIRDGGYRVPARTPIFQRVSSRARDYDRLFTDPEGRPHEGSRVLGTREKLY